MVDQIAQLMFKRYTILIIPRKQFGVIEDSDEILTFRLDSSQGAGQGHAEPALTLRVYAHAMRNEETELSFAEFGDPNGGPSL